MVTRVERREQSFSRAPIFRRPAGRLSQFCIRDAELTRHRFTDGPGKVHQPLWKDLWRSNIQHLRKCIAEFTPGERLAIDDVINSGWRVDCSDDCRRGIFVIDDREETIRSAQYWHPATTDIFEEALCETVIRTVEKREPQRHSCPNSTRETLRGRLRIKGCAVISSRPRLHVLSDPAVSAIRIDWRKGLLNEKTRATGKCPIDEQCRAVPSDAIHFLPSAREECPNAGTWNMGSKIDDRIVLCHRAVYRVRIEQIERQCRCADALTRLEVIE